MYFNIINDLMIKDSNISKNNASTSGGIIAENSN